MKLKTASFLALLALGACVTTDRAPEPGTLSAGEYLERVREWARGLRARDELAVVTAGGKGATDAFAREFAALGELEEIDAWKLENPTKERVTELRKLFDGAGGKSVALVDAEGRPLEAPSPTKPSHLEGVLASSFAAAGTGRAYVVEPTGEISWQRRGCGNIHQVQRHGGWLYYSNGSVYRCRLPSTKAEHVFTPSCCMGAGALGFEVQPNGNVVVSVNSMGEVLELEAETWRVLARVKVDVRDGKGEAPGAHGRLRMVHKTPSGTYLVSCGMARFVREYRPDGTLVWQQEVPVMAFDAVRRANGNTIVSHINGLTEYAPDHREVWKFACGDLPALKLSCLCGVQELANGNLVVGTWSSGERDASRATAFELTRDRRCVWAWYPNADSNMMTCQR